MVTFEQGPDPDGVETIELAPTEELEAARERFRELFGVEPNPDESAARLQRRIELGEVRELFRQLYGVEPNPDESAARLQRRIQVGLSGEGAGDNNEDDLPDLQILSSPSMTWHLDSDTGNWYVRHHLPGLPDQYAIMFEATEEQMDAIFGEGNRPPIASGISSNRIFAEEQFRTVFGGNVAEIEGEGNLQQEMDRVLSLALDRQGLPEWIRQDPGAMSLTYVAITDERSDEWLYEQLSSRSSFKNRFPGVSDLESRGLSITEAVEAHTQFETQLKNLHAASGFSPDAISPEIAGRLISRGYSTKQVAESYSVWKRMRDHAPALQAFNEVLQANGQQPIQGPQKMYEFLTGNAPPEVYSLYEGAAVQEAATAAGLDDLFDADDALSLATATEQSLTRDQAFERFSGVAAQALRFRHQLNLQAYDLSVDDLVDIAFGQAPRSGKDSAEVGEILARISKQAEGFLRERATPFFGFTESGRPQARSFGELRQESV